VIDPRSLQNFVLEGKAPPPKPKEEPAPPKKKPAPKKAPKKRGK
jgi:hypothetical protein